MIAKYDIAHYARMMANETRLAKYTSALRETVKPDSVVLDIGTGSGILAFIACQCGAKTVYAVEPDPIIEVAQQLAEDNGLSPKIRFINDYIERVSFDEPVDVIVSDLRGSLPVFGSSLLALGNSRDRFLKPGGSMIPLRDTLWLSLVLDGGLRQKLISPWGSNIPTLDLTALERRLTRMTYRRSLTPEQIGASAPWAVIDYMTNESPDVTGAVEWRIPKRSTAFGLCFWFESQLSEYVVLKGGPYDPPLPYAHLFAPFHTPLAMPAESLARVTVSAQLAQDRYHWTWQVESASADGRILNTIAHSDLDI